MDAHWRALRRDLDASERAPEDLDPKTRTLGLAPSIFLEVDAVRKRQNRSLATPKIFVYRWSERKTAEKKGIAFLSDIESHERAKKKTICKKCL